MGATIWGMDPNPYQSPRILAEPSLTDLLPYDHATARYVLAVLRDMHRQMCQFDSMVDPRVSLSFDTTVAQWRGACDLLGWRELGEAYNQLWEIDASPAEWRAALVPAREKRLLDVCALIARHTTRPQIRPTYLLGCTCRAAGAFEAIRWLLARAGADPREIAPSTPLSPYARQYYQLFLGPISRLAPGRLPLVRIRTPANEAATGTLLCGAISGWMCLMIGAVSSLPPLIVAGILLCFGSYSLLMFAANNLPDSVEFGKLRTFRDLAVVVAAGSDAESSTCG